MSSTRRKTVALVVPALLVGLVTSGCGVADQRVRPGLAAEVDGTRVSLGEVDEVTRAVCDFNSDDPESQFQPRPRSLQRQVVAVYRMREVAAAALLEERGLELPEGYDDAVAEAAATYADEPESRRETLVDNDVREIYVAAAAQSLGTEVVGEEAAAADPASAQSEGLGAIDSWLGEQDVEFNPVLGVATRDGGLVSEDGGLAVPVSDKALASTIDFADPEVDAKITAQVESLPAAQVCG